MPKYEDLTVPQWNHIAEVLAAERLPCVNALVEEAVPTDGLYVRYGKRALDVAISALALAVTLPLNLVFSVCTYLDVGNPILFRQSRIGKGGKPFVLLKFRNMTNERDERGNLLSASKRITRFGKFMRRTSMDELLNFWSVLKGDMSIIGPRPLVPEYTVRYNRRHASRLKVRPGLECPPREFGSYWTWQEQLDNDVWYVEHVSLKTDLYMFCCLVRYALDRKSSVARSEGDDRGSFMGYSLEGVAITEAEVPDSLVEYVKKTVSENGMIIDEC